MHDSFYWSNKVENFLFKGFSVHSNRGLIGICFIIFGMAFMFEYLRYIQTIHKQRELKLRVKQLKLLCPTESATLLQRTITDPTNPLNITLFDRAMLFGTEVSLWLILQNLGYFIMLSVMMYDGWFLVAAVLGGGLGYFVFGQSFMRINIQNCQLMRSAFCTQICGELAHFRLQNYSALSIRQWHVKIDVQHFIEKLLEDGNPEGHSTPPADDTPSTSHGNLNTKSYVESNVIKVQCH